VAVSEVLARSESPRGEVVLLRRERDSELELRVNGVFVMDTLETSTERVLATLAIDELQQVRPPEAMQDLRVLVGGLGLGFTLAAFLRSPLVAEVVVAEIEPALVAWHHDGLIAPTAGVSHDSRVRMHHGDVRDVVRAQSPGSLDAIVLDVDNGPGFLVYDANADIYEETFLAACKTTLRRDGKVAVWSNAPAPQLHQALWQVFGSADQHHMTVRLGDRSDSYTAYVAPARPVDEEENEQWFSAR
jgi:spermidine synthase